MDNVQTSASSAATSFGLNSIDSYTKSLGSDPNSFDNWLEGIFNPTQYKNQMTSYQNAVDREFNAEQAKIQRDWLEEMSNTSYQRAMADMKKAGLNPILAYQQGGASTPSGASAGSSGSSNYQGSDFMKTVFNGIASGLKIFAGLI